MHSTLDSQTTGNVSFDSAFYLLRNRDVRESGSDPWEHYEAFGKAEGRPPSRKDELRSITELCPELKQLPMFSIWEQHNVLIEELLKPWFDQDYYEKNNPDLAPLAFSGRSLALHFLVAGAKEMRRPSEQFDTRYYLDEYPDVRNGGGNPLIHYIVYGFAERRFPTAIAEAFVVVKSSGYFDESYYLHHNPDVASIARMGITSALEHYIKFGAQEGRNPSALFDGASYLKNNPDVFLSGINPIVHWIRSGRKEGRISPERGRHKIALNSICNPYRTENSAATICGEVFFSILTASYNTKPKYLRELAMTIFNQTYRDWEWVIVDDGSSSAETINCLKILGEATKINVIFRSNGGISAAANTGLAAAKGNYIALVDHDDLLARDVLQLVADAVHHEPKTDLVYTDECKISEDDEVYDLSLKPGWSPALLESTMYVGHLTVYRRELVVRLGGFRSEFDGTQDYDLALRVALTKPTCAHVPRVGYLWRAIIGSTALAISEKSYSVDRQRLALESFVREAGRTGTVASGKSTGWWRIDYDAALLAQPISIVIPTAGGKRLIRGEERDLVCSAVDSIKKKLFFSSYEIVVVHNNNLSREQRLQLASHPEVRLVAYAALEFNLAEKINLGVSSARGEYVLLINDDIEIVTERGGDMMLSYMLADASVGVIGCLCLYENGTVQHNGVVLLEQGASHYGIGRPHGVPEAPLFLQSRRDCFAVTGALMLFSKEAFLRLGGYDLGLPINYNDVDFCIRMRRTGLRCVVDPCVSIYHYESSTALGGQTLDSELFFRKHPGLNDPFFNPGFDQRKPWLQIASRSEPLSFSSPELFGPWLNKRIGERRSCIKGETELRLTVGMPVFNQPARLLKEALRSVKLQTWPNVEIVIVDDGSTLAETVAWLDAIQTSGDQRVIRHECNLGIAGANRTLLASATGDFLLPIDADDWVTIDALEILAEAILVNSQAKIFYSDEFKSDMLSQQFSPFFKPDFDPILLMNCCYPTHLMAINVGWAREIGAYSDDRAQWCHDYDVLTRSLARGEEPVHVPELLYAWRINPGSTASESSGTKPYAFDSQRFVLERLIAELGKAADVGVRVNPLFETPAMWMLEAKRDLERTVTVDASRILEAPDAIHKVLVDQAAVSAFVHISSSDRPVETTRAALAAPILFDERVLVCSGIIRTNKEKIAWSGGFVSGMGLVHDPYIGAEASDSGYHGQLFCQRRVDVPSPIEMLVRSDMLSSALHEIAPEELTPDKLAIYVALQVNAACGFCVTTPHVVFYPGARVAEFVPLDRAQALRNARFKPSNLYHPELSRDLAYQVER